ncbi:ABC transporter permease [Halomonas denitrificans]|uniref:ABC transporter permease n=1 Tax=Halomonas denitrificans TaxID=370769 RepID=UPI001C990AAA|nr:FtsX-like permease family protein [Halomonas denitrificans]MBY5968445.1 ABC transporter permease [Halomonas denitrificans]
MRQCLMALRSLRRDLRAGDVRALLVALTLAVAASTMMGFFLDRLERGLTRQASQMMGGDVVLEQSDPFTAEVRQRLETAGMTLSDQVDLVSMASRDGAFQPVSIKAVDQDYPLYGASRVDQGQGTEELTTGPAPGEVWLAPRLETLLDIELGDQLDLGQGSFRVSGWIEREADQSAGFGSFNPRVMMHVDDVESTGLIQPGSRIEYEILAAGSPDAVASLSGWLAQLRAEGVEVRDVRVDRPRLGSALERAETYLSLAGLAAVLLAGVAVAMATRRYVDRHLDTAALLRCFGASQQDLTRVFALQLAGLAVVASTLGAALGLAGQAALLALMQRFLPLELPPPGILPLWLGILTAVAVLAGFAGPTLLRLKRVSALKVLRRELDPLPASGWTLLGAAALAFGGLLWLYSGSLGLAAGLLVGGMLALALLWGLAGLILDGVLKLVSRWQHGRPDSVANALRLGARQLARRRTASLGQMLAFAVTFFAMTMIALVRGDLLTTWQAQLPDDTPNHFAINIQPTERDAFERQLGDIAQTTSDLYPMVRGRITAINGEPPRQAVPADAQGENALRRELNLTWRASLPSGNRLVAGEWFAASANADDWLSQVDAEPAASSPETVTAPISVERELAERLGLTLGDRLSFSIGADTLVGEITSLRDLDWDSFKPNFYVIFPPGVLERFGHSFITAFYLEADRKADLGQLVASFPGVTLLDVDALLGQVRDVLGQVTRAVEVVLAFVLLAGVSVLYAALIASQPVRAHESGLLRVFGAGRRLLDRVQWSEFAVLGLASGLMSALLAEVATAALYLLWLDLPPRFHLWIWLVVPLSGALILGAVGHLLSRGLRRQAPAASLGLLGSAE